MSCNPIVFSIFASGNSLAGICKKFIAISFTISEILFCLYDLLIFILSERYASSDTQFKIIFSLSSLVNPRPSVLKNLNFPFNGVAPGIPSTPGLFASNKRYSSPDQDISLCLPEESTNINDIDVKLPNISS